MKRFMAIGYAAAAASMLAATLVTSDPVDLVLRLIVGATYITAALLLFVTILGQEWAWLAHGPSRGVRAVTEAVQTVLLAGLISALWLPACILYSLAVDREGASF